MKNFGLFLLATAAAISPAMAQDQAPAGQSATASIASRGKMLVDVKGARLAPVYRVNDDGSVVIIFEGSMISVPGDTLSVVGGKLTTSLKKTDVIALR